MVSITDDVGAVRETGRKSGIGTSAVQLSATARQLSRGVVIKAAADNTDTIYVGLRSTITADAADATDGYPLAAGEALAVDVDLLSKVYVIAKSGTQKAFWFAG